MKKKILSLVLAMTMVMGMSLAAFAADDPTIVGNVEGADATAAAGAEITATSSTNLPIIKVTVPVASTIVINPFQLTVGDGDDAKNDQILAAVQELKSESNVPLVVNIDSFKATVADTSTVTIAKASAAKATTKSAYITLRMGKDLATTDAAEIKKIKTVIATTTGASLASAYTLEAATFTGTTCTTPAKVQYQIGGDVNANPVIVNSDKTTTPDPWTDAAADHITVAVKFTFTPQIVTE